MKLYNDERKTPMASLDLTPDLIALTYHCATGGALFSYCKKEIFLKTDYKNHSFKIWTFLQHKNHQQSVLFPNYSSSGHT
jgi:hypothetical protein